MKSNRRGLLILGAIVFLLVFWAPAIFVPYWQDDFGFLLEARNAAAQHKTLGSVFTSNPPGCFWRPVSIGLYWRFVEGTLNGDARAAHAVSILLLIASSAAVGWLTTTLLRIRFPDIDAVLGGVLAAVLYGVHGARFLSVTWACGVQELFLVLFSALCLRFWLVAGTTDGWRGLFAAAMVLPCAAMAFLSKETAIILPALALLLTVWIWPNRRPSRRTWFLGAMLVALTCGWWMVHQQMLRFAPPDAPAQYRMEWGTNALRNGACLGLFALNMPRETIRFVVSEHSAGAAVWGVVCLALQAAGCLVLLRAAWGRISLRDILIGGAFFAVGLAPHLFLAWNCYEYYTSMALFAFAFFVGIAAHRTRLACAGAAIIVLSCTIAAVGNYLLPYPSLIARARWGHKQIEIVRAMRDANPKAFRRPIFLSVDDKRRFHCIDVSGLAYSLGLSDTDFVVLIPESTVLKWRPPILVVPSEGDVYLRNVPDRKQ